MLLFGVLIIRVTCFADLMHLFLFVLLLHIPVNSYGHVGMVSSPSQTFFLGKLEQAVNQYSVHIL